MGRRTAAKKLIDVYACAIVDLVRYDIRFAIPSCCHQYCIIILIAELILTPDFNNSLTMSIIPSLDATINGLSSFGPLSLLMSVP
jgi:hypothetical protein